MKKTDEEVVQVLQELTEFVNDRVKGYEHAANETKNPGHISFYRELASQSRKFADELNKEISTFGGNPETDTTIKGKFYRQWMDLKATLTGKDENAIINSNLYGEEWAQKAYDDALASAALPQGLQQIVERQKQASLQACDQLKKMKDS
ncbi:PA2169 family four-helix-bundle protein [Pontibacter qinzhouensis]|uniref:PA2169 family four-helix-bundle protein n=1 Tax=Pontibacter qinzhouensis TaxID=2603253 RepID=A0A5C8KEM5_9BACT|nr:PA2169 family four-helix-bundle protein [Pontibacter qinzhouensis]TXK52097.1 PA2169 family four-helix-bundle protein [Pontibacter qinzhouensis]